MTSRTYHLTPSPQLSLPQPFTATAFPSTPLNPHCLTVSPTHSGHILGIYRTQDTGRRAQDTGHRTQDSRRLSAVSPFLGAAAFALHHHPCDSPLQDDEAGLILESYPRIGTDLQLTTPYGGQMYLYTHGPAIQVGRQDSVLYCTFVLDQLLEEANLSRSGKGKSEGQMEGRAEYTVTCSSRTKPSRDGRPS